MNISNPTLSPNVQGLSPLRLVIGCVLLLLLYGGSLPASAATLKIATLSPEGSSWMKMLRKHGKNVEQRTGGSVKFKFYPWWGNGR